MTLPLMQQPAGRLAGRSPGQGRALQSAQPTAALAPARRSARAPVGRPVEPCSVGTTSRISSACTPEATRYPASFPPHGRAGCLHRLPRLRHPAPRRRRRPGHHLAKYSGSQLTTTYGRSSDARRGARGVATGSQSRGRARRFPPASVADRVSPRRRGRSRRAREAPAPDPTGPREMLSTWRPTPCHRRLACWNVSHARRRPPRRALDRGETLPATSRIRHESRSELAHPRE